MNIDRNNLVHISNNSAYDGWPVWTPDGKVIYSSNRGGSPNTLHLYRTDSNGNSTVLLYKTKGGIGAGQHICRW